MPETTAALLRELEAAHIIIRNALNIMTTTQKLEWADRNAVSGIDGEGITRANEREAVIARAKGAQSSTATGKQIRHPYSFSFQSCSCGSTFKDHCVCRRDTSRSKTMTASSGVALSSNTD